MASYSMTCTCGEVMSVDADTREAALSMLKAGMTETAIDAHMQEHHKPGEPRPTLQQVHAMIEQTLQAAAA